MQKKCNWGKKFSKEIDYIFATAKKYEAEMLIFFSDNPVEILNECMVRSNVKQIVIEKSDCETISYIEYLNEKIKLTKIHVL